MQRCAFGLLAGGFAFSTLLLSACSGGQSQSSSPATSSHVPFVLPPALPANRTLGKIQHVVIIVQENRSFDDLFQGYPGADTQSYGYDSHGNKITLQPEGLSSQSTREVL